MDDPRWLRIITIGLVLAALVVGYFLLTGGLSVKKTNTVPQANKVQQTVAPSATVEPTPFSLIVDSQVSPTPKPSSVSAYSTIASRYQVEAQALPKTGFPVELATIFSISAIICGWSLCKYPH